MGRERDVELSWLPFVFVYIFYKCSCASSDIYEEGATQKSFSRCQTPVNKRLEENWSMIYQNNIESVNFGKNVIESVIFGIKTITD